MPDDLRLLFFYASLRQRDFFFFYIYIYIFFFVRCRLFSVRNFFFFFLTRASPFCTLYAPHPHLGIRRYTINHLCVHIWSLVLLCVLFPSFVVFFFLQGEVSERDVDFLNQFSHRGKYRQPKDVNVYTRARKIGNILYTLKNRLSSNGCNSVKNQICITTQ